MPFHLGVIYNGTTPYFTISRVGWNKSGTAATTLCQKGDTDCDNQEDVMILNTGLTLSGWVNLPITQVGWFNMTYATTGGAWTSTVPIKSGFNANWKTEWYSFPVAENGAATSTHMLANGGTAPVFTTHFFEYNDDGSRVNIDVYQDGDGGADGLGAVNALMSLPYSPVLSTSGASFYSLGCRIQGQTTITNATISPVAFTDGTKNTIQFNYISGTPGLANITNGMFTSGLRNISCQLSYPIMGRNL
jgi:hypothetical protein